MRRGAFLGRLHAIPRLHARQVVAHTAHGPRPEARAEAESTEQKWHNTMNAELAKLAAEMVILEKDNDVQDSKDAKKGDDKDDKKDDKGKKDDKKSDKKVNSEKDAKAKVLTGAVEP